MSGENLTGERGGFTFDDVHLAFPPPQPPPIHLGATGPKMTALAGEVSDGLILSVFSTPEFVRIERDIMAANGGADTPITTLAFLVLGETSAEARAKVRPLLGLFLADGESSAMTDAIGITDELRALAAKGGPEGLAAEMPDEWVDQLCVCGDLDACVTRIQALLDAGSDEVALAPLRADSLSEISNSSARPSASADQHRLTNNKENPMKHKSRSLAAMVAAGLLVVTTACGSGDNSEGGGGAGRRGHRRVQLGRRHGQIPTSSSRSRRTAWAATSTAPCSRRTTPTPRTASSSTPARARRTSRSRRPGTTTRPC